MFVPQLGPVPSLIPVGRTVREVLEDQTMNMVRSTAKLLVAYVTESQES